MGRIYDHLELIGPRVLVRPLSDLDVSVGGIVLPDSARHQQNRAVVERVGPGELVNSETVAGAVVCARRPLPFDVGDLVLYQKFAGTRVVLDGHERLMLMEDEVQARVAKAHVELVQHGDDRKSDHLEGEPCLMCQQAKDAIAKTELAKMREELVKASSSTSDAVASASA